MNRTNAAFLANQWKAQGFKVGMASGGFDLLHAGHLSFLMGLKAKVDRLVVAVMCDSVLAGKGPNRPIIPDWQRLALIAGLGCVDGAFIFEEVGDDRNLEVIRPDVFGRGDGHTQEIFERATLDRLGIKLALIHSPRITSTTEIINRIRK